ncbi:MAG TPA: hypothetical protein ENG45_00935, partial [Candidatus Aenigmarchaeota archaeon]|nr:hypothetical protein [Candidatus Aenigmarchaeota archaeon]
LNRNHIDGTNQLFKLAFSDVFWDKIVEIRKRRVKEIYVYDVCVNERIPTFIGGFGGIVLHNTALAVGIAKELGRDVPFVPITASEIYSTEIKKTEFLTQALRKAIGVRIHEMRKIYEGEVKEMKIEKEQHPYNPYVQIPASAVITLATKAESTKLSMDQSFEMQLVQQGVELGDIIQIDVDGGRIVKLGKSEKAVKKEKLDLTSVKQIPVPSGPVAKEKEFVYVLTLHQLDVASSRSGIDMFSLLFGGRERKEIDNEVRKQVDEQVKAMVESGKAEILPGVLYIDEINMLDIECFAFLNRAMEAELAPIIILATNRGLTKIRGTDIVSPHGLPQDFLDRILIINTHPYSSEEIRKILEIRAKSEGIELDTETLNYLTKLGTEASLRYSIQLLAPAMEIAKANGRNKIKKIDVEKARKLFADVKKSLKVISNYEKLMLK